MCGQSLKTIFLNLKNHHVNTIYQKNCLKKKKILYFQSCNYKIFMKIHHVSRVLLHV
jgi:hypothetical protein